MNDEYYPDDRSGDSFQAGNGNRRYSQDSAASLPVSADRPGDRTGAQEAHRGAEERDVQRAVFSGTLSRQADHARSSDRGSDRAGWGRIAADRSPESRRVAD